MVWDGGLDAQYQDAVSRPHRRWARIDVTSAAGDTLYQGVPFADGTLSANLAQRVTRSLAFTVPETDPTRPWAPRTQLGAIDPTALLAPYGNRIRAYAGIEYGDGRIASFPIFYGRIDWASVSDAGLVSVSCSDLAAEVTDGKFEVPTNSVPTLSVLNQWKALVSGALPNATYGTSDGAQTGALIGPLTWDTDRGQACDDMASGVGCLWWSLADGRFVMRRQPWSNPDLASVTSIGDGVSTARRIMSRYNVKVSREGVSNSLVMSSERLDGSAPLTAIARDLVPTSPTYYLGSYGKKPTVIQNQAPYTQPQLDYAAAVQLHYAKSLNQRWEGVSIIPDASLELGDLITCQAGGWYSLQVITGFTFPLREGATMPLTLRAWSPLVGV